MKKEMGKKTTWDLMTWILLCVSILVLAFGAVDRNRILIIFGGIFLALFIVKRVLEMKEW
jgi:hypothetical protein